MHGQGVTFGVRERRVLVRGNHRLLQDRKSLLAEERVDSEVPPWRTKLAPSLRCIEARKGAHSGCDERYKIS